MLKGQDILVALLLASDPNKVWRQADIASELEISTGEVNNSLKRAREASILVSRPRRSNLVIHVNPKQLSDTAKKLLGVESGEYGYTSRPQVKAGALEELIVHGIKYFFPPKWGEETRGIPTGFAAPLIKEIVTAKLQEIVPVWQHPQGHTRGISLEPIHKSCPNAGLKNPALYELLALVDVFRIGRSREVANARELLRHRLKGEK